MGKGVGVATIQQLKGSLRHWATLCLDCGHDYTNLHVGGNCGLSCKRVHVKVAK